jgi:DNA-binding GntR family transcriptional regulator
MVQAELRQSILSGRLAPGEVLSQVALAQRFGVSRGPIREALRMLQREGLVEGEVNKRMRVIPFAADDLEQLYALRIVTEALAIRVSVPFFEPDELSTLQRQLGEMEATTGKLEPWEEVHRAFHRLLVSHAGERTIATIEQLSDHASRYRRMNLSQEPRAWSIGATEHREIVAACVERDAVGASRLLAEHLARTALTVMMIAAPEHEPFMVRAAVRMANGSEEPARGAVQAFSAARRNGAR